MMGFTYEDNAMLLKEYDERVNEDRKNNYLITRFQKNERRDSGYISNSEGKIIFPHRDLKINKDNYQAMWAVKSVIQKDKYDFVDGFIIPSNVIEFEDFDVKGNFWDDNFINNEVMSIGGKTGIDDIENLTTKELAQLMICTRSVIEKITICGIEYFSLVYRYRMQDFARIPVKIKGEIYTLYVEKYNTTSVGRSDKSIVKFTDKLTDFHTVFGPHNIDKIKKIDYDTDHIEENDKHMFKNICYYGPYSIYVSKKDYIDELPIGFNDIASINEHNVNSKLLEYILDINSDAVIYWLNNMYNILDRDAKRCIIFKTFLNRL